jgi:hypothetical protein
VNSQQPLEQAEAAAAAAARQSDQYALVLTAVQAAQIVQQQQPQQHVGQHHHPQPRPEFDARKWLVIGGVGSVCAIAFALASIAIAIGACCVTCCLLVLRSMWRHYLKGL